MLTHPTLHLLTRLGLTGMAEAFRLLADNEEVQGLAHAQWLASLLDDGVTWRNNRRLAPLALRLRKEKLRHHAVLEDIDYRAPRGLDRRLFDMLLKGDWIKNHENPDGQFKFSHLWSRKLPTCGAGREVILVDCGFACKSFGGFLEAVAAAVELEQMAMVHEAVQDGRALGVAGEISAPILHDAAGRDDDAAVQFVALMDQILQQKRQLRRGWCERGTDCQAPSRSRSKMLRSRASR
ncbi:IstB-like ATP binding protein [Bradyrhizobium shewense]|uniref:IstB-like ATP binding protein n=1 Tax=Bradyrhizobium shewense TaxID=1761772 RepID=A0A1C3XUD3_9BRAD|nr:IstB-like ATP binding protein [Bradyrhizobium shewense]